MQDHLRLLIVGGYGTFGGRIVELVENAPELTLIIAGRSYEQARAYCASRSRARAMLEAAVFDRNGDAVAQLRSLRPDILIDASGPFQAYGKDHYRLVEACLEERVNYLDLADGSVFVDGIAQFDERARAAGIFVLSGVSSFPVLTAAVLHRLSESIARVDSIRGGIAPSPYAGVGENVIRAIASYAGQPVSLVRDGASTTGYPFTEQMRFTIAPPGHLPLRNTMFSLVDVPDLKALAKLWPGARRIWMGAGPVPEILHRALIALSWLVRRRVVAHLSPLAPLMHFVMNRLRWGEHRGGMFVEIEGATAAGGGVKRSWHLIAEGDDGPLIPSMAVQAVVQRVTVGQAPSAGARAAVRDLELDDYEKLFEGRQIVTGVRDEPGESAPLYARVLGAAFDELPAEIRAMHDVHGTAVATGRGSVERGSGLLARCAAALIGFPKAVSDIEVSVRFEVAGGRETWTRSFGRDSFHSEQFAGTGRSQHLLCERFGALTFAMALVVEQGRLKLVLRRWSAFGVPLPMFLCPRSTAFETAEDGRFRFHVEISHPLTGLIVRYRGWLAPACEL